MSVAPNDDIILPPSVPECEKMVHSWPGQDAIHHHNKNQILYVMNTTTHLQFGHSCLQGANTGTSNWQAPNIDPETIS